MPWRAATTGLICGNAAARQTNSRTRSQTYGKRLCEKSCKALWCRVAFRDQTREKVLFGKAGKR